MLPLEALSAVLWEHFWAVLGASWAVLKSSWVVVGLLWAVSTLSSTVLALCLGPLGAFWRLRRPRGCVDEFVGPPGPPLLM